MILKAYETYRDENGNLEHDKLHKLFPECKPKTIYEQHRFIKNKTKIKLDPSEEIQLQPQTGFHFNSMGILELRPLIKSIRESVDESECLTDISKEHDVSIEFIKLRYRHRNSPLSINNECPYSLCIQRFYTTDLLNEHIKNDHSMQSKLPKILEEAFNFLNEKKNDLESVKKQAKIILKTFAKEKMKPRSKKNCHINYWLMKECGLNLLIKEHFNT